MESVAGKRRKVSTTYIPNDIAFSILSKLPIKSVKRFECVRKAWSLLSEKDHFMNMFRNNLLSNSHRCPYYNGGSMLLRDFELGKDVFYSISGKRFENKVKLDFSNAYANRFKFRIFGFGSINGTFCLYQDDYYGKTVLWNPSTHAIKLVSLPYELVDLSIPNVEHFLSINDTYYVHGFGYDNLRNDYKVICYVTITGEHAGYGDMSLDPVWVIYSLRTNSWRRIPNVYDMPCSLARIDGTQVYMDGVCHWLAEEVDDTLEGPCLVSFYFSNEEFFITYIPSYLDDCFDLHTLWINLAVLNASIALISYHEEMTNFHISILGEYGIKESWTKLFVVGPLSCIECPIGVGTKGEIFFIRKDNELVFLDLSTQTIVELAYKEVNSIDRIVIYKENILPIGGISN